MGFSGSLKETAINRVRKQFRNLLLRLLVKKKRSACAGHLAMLLVQTIPAKQ